MELCLRCGVHTSWNFPHRLNSTNQPDKISRKIPTGIRTIVFQKGYVPQWLATIVDAELPDPDAALGGRVAHPPRVGGARDGQAHGDGQENGRERLDASFASASHFVSQKCVSQMCVLELS